MAKLVAKQFSLLSYVKTPNLARSKGSETSAGESTVCEEKDKGDVDIESDEEGKVEDISTENRIDLR